MPTARRLAAMKNDFNRRRTNEDRKAYVTANKVARAEVKADPALHVSFIKWLDAWHRHGNLAGFPTFADWRAANTAAAITH